MIMELIDFLILMAPTTIFLLWIILFVRPSFLGIALGRIFRFKIIRIIIISMAMFIFGIITISIYFYEFLTKYQIFFEVFGGLLSVGVAVFFGSYVERMRERIQYEIYYKKMLEFFITELDTNVEYLTNMFKGERETYIKYDYKLKTQTWEMYKEQLGNYTRDIVFDLSNIYYHLYIINERGHKDIKSWEFLQLKLISQETISNIISWKKRAQKIIEILDKTLD